MIRRRRVHTRDAGELVDEFLAAARERLDGRLAPRPPGLVAHIDQVASGIRARLGECGIPTDDDVVRAALLIVADTLIASHGQIPICCDTSARVWSVTAQFALAVLALDANDGDRG